MLIASNLLFATFIATTAVFWLFLITTTTWEVMRLHIAPQLLLLHEQISECYFCCSLLAAFNIRQNMYLSQAWSFIHCHWAPIGIQVVSQKQHLIQCLTALLANEKIYFLQTLLKIFGTHIEFPYCMIGSEILDFKTSNSSLHLKM